MYGLPNGISVLNEDPYNVGGTVCWYCKYESKDQADEVLKKLFPEGEKKGFSVLSERPDERRAMVLWEFNGSTFIGDVLVNKELEAVGVCMEVHFGYMVFNLEFSHISYPRFPDGHPALDNLYN